MCVNNNFTNPTIINKYIYDDALIITGDIGLKSIILNNQDYLYCYHIEEKELTDIDTIKDIL